MFKNQKSVKSPRRSEDNLPLLLGTLQMHWQRHFRLCCQMAQIVSNTTTQKLNIGVNKPKHCTEAEHGRHTCGRHRVRFGIIAMIQSQTITVTSK